MKASAISLLALSSLMFMLCSATPLSRARPRGQEQTAPPPLKIITKADRNQLEATKDIKGRVHVTLDLAEAHLAKAETETSRLNYDGAAAETGNYWALIEDLFTFLGSLKQDSNKTRDLYKRVELTLRSHGSRLTIMRRSTPATHAVWIKETEEFARRGRTEALNSFYGQTVVRDRPGPGPQRSGNSAVKNETIPPEKKP